MAHLTILTPGRCGLYETTRELVAGLRERGVDSRMVDPAPEKNKLLPKFNEDRGALYGDIEWARQADVLVSHSGLGNFFADTSQPIVLVAHGRPHNSFITERDGGAPVLSHYYRENSNPRLKTVVTFWWQHIVHHRALMPDKLIKLVTAPVDLERFAIGEGDYGFGGKRGEINVVCTDGFRQDIDPFWALTAYALWARQNKGARLHLYGVPKQSRGYAPLIRRIQDDGNMGEIRQWVDNLPAVYSSADVCLTGNWIDTRSVREAQACGCPVVRVDHQNPLITADMRRALNTARNEAREKALQYDHRRSAAEFEKILRAAV